jgi:serine/threonine protein kinase/predicted negative regulator of RcsB-dependent stress response
LSREVFRLGPERRKQVKHLFQAALELDPGRRAGFLEEACGEDITLREEVEALISLREGVESFNKTVTIHDRADTFSEDTTAELGLGRTSLLGGSGYSAEQLNHSFIGNYRIIREIGHGGMGAVYLAARADDEFQKQVAIKVLKRGMDTDFTIRRFRTERQILAALDHPNIARLLDGGTTPDGRPYFVMEYIEGRPLIEYCNGRNLSTRERLLLFRHVCSAVQYAHQNLVIHRDIKPGNILVTADSIPKLLDFGIAKLLNPELQAQPADHTATSMRLLTPQYASPEQVRGDAITTATDVYLLGVLLYELLTGQRPFHITSSAPHEIFKVICEQEPDRPSTAVTRAARASDTKSSNKTVAVARPSGKDLDARVEKLRRQLSGDLDNIVLMAMRKEPERRYGSVSELSEDIRRHLEGRPVRARKDTFSYRTSKFVRRNRAAVTAAAFVLLILIAGIVATTWAAMEARKERARAEKRFNEVRLLANSFMFELHDAIENLSGSTPARELLVRRAVEYLDSLASESGDDQELQRELATAYQKVGDVQGNPYSPNLGDSDGALASYRKALEIRERIAQANPANVEDLRALSSSLSRVGDILWAKGDAPAALETYRKGLAIDEELASSSSEKAVRRNLWIAYRRTAYAQAQVGDFAGAVETFNKSREIIEQLAAIEPNDPQVMRDVSANYTSLGEVVGEMGDLAGALEYFRKSLDIDRRLAEADPANAKARDEVGVSFANVGEALKRMGDVDGALESYRKSLELFEATSKADPTNAQSSRNVAVESRNVGEMLERKRDIPGALSSYRRALEISERLVAADPSNILLTTEQAGNLARIALALAKGGIETAAIDNADRAVAVAEQVSGNNPDNAELQAFAAFIFAYKGRVHSTIAGNRADHWKHAREWLKRGSDILIDLKNRGAWTSSTFGDPNDLAREIAVCDANIARLKAE